MTAHYSDDRVTLWHGDCRDVLRELADESVAAVVTDPPYELGFMGRSWDASGVAYDVAVWRECLRVLQPGGHLLAFGGTRTWHRLTVAIEDAGFEIRDSITWLYASGFPKSLDVSKAIDRAAGATREVVGKRTGRAATPRTDMRGGNYANPDAALDLSAITAPATEAAQQWQGWGTALKPASEPIVVARKPLGGTVAACVLEHGTGALNIDDCRVGAAEKLVRPQIQRTDNDVLGKGLGVGVQVEPAGRWPANVVLTHAPDCGPDDTTPCVDGCPVADLDAQSAGTRSDKASASGSAGRAPIDGGVYAGGAGVGGSEVRVSYADEGGASRFFPTFRYQAKAPTRERPSYVTDDGRKIAHPTVKPLALIRWLVRLVTPPGGLVVDPFAGSGTTGEAAVLEGFRAVLVELDADHLPLIAERLTRVLTAVAPLTPTVRSTADVIAAELDAALPSRDDDPFGLDDGALFALPTTTAPTRPAVVLDPFGGTGTTGLVARALGRRAHLVDGSLDYCRAARWRVTDPGELARALEVEKPPPAPEGIDSLLDLLVDEEAAP